MKALSSRTYCEWSFVCPDSSGDSKGRAQRLVSLSTVYWKYGSEYKKYQARVRRGGSAQRLSFTTCKLEFPDGKWSSLKMTGIAALDIGYLKKAKKIDKITFLLSVSKTGDSTQSVFCLSCGFHVHTRTWTQSHSCDIFLLGVSVSQWSMQHGLAVREPTGDTAKGGSVNLW